MHTLGVPFWQQVQAASAHFGIQGILPYVPSMGESFCTVAPNDVFAPNFFYKTDSEWPEMDFKHKF